MREVKPEQEAVLLDHLERRRAANDQAMWQAPGLTVAAQAFLLSVLADGSLAAWARLAVLLGGLAAIWAALIALLRLRAREVQYAEAFAIYSEAAGIPDIRPPALPKGQGGANAPTRTRRLDAWTRTWAVSDRLAAGHLTWSFALLVLAVADVAVFIAA